MHRLGAVDDEERAVRRVQRAGTHELGGDVAAGDAGGRGGAAQAGVAVDREAVAGDDLGAVIGGAEGGVVAQAVHVVDIGGDDEADALAGLAAFGGDPLGDGAGVERADLEAEDAVAAGLRRLMQCPIAHCL